MDSQYLYRVGPGLPDIQAVGNCSTAHVVNPYICHGHSVDTCIDDRVTDFFRRIKCRISWYSKTVSTDNGSSTQSRNIGLLQIFLYILKHKIKIIGSILLLAGMNHTVIHIILSKCEKCHIIRRLIRNFIILLRRMYIVFLLLFSNF